MALDFGMPIAVSSSRQAMPAAPAPLTTSLNFLMSRPVSSGALRAPAAAMMAVRRHGNEVALVGVVVDGRGVLRDRVHRHGDARRVGEGQIALRGKRFGRRYFELAGLALGMELKGFLLGKTSLRGFRASAGCH